MHVFLKQFLVFLLLFNVPLLILIENDVLRLVSLLCSCIAIIQQLQSLRQWLSVVHDQRLAIDVGRWEILIAFLSVKLLITLPLLLIFLLFVLIVELPVNGIVVMRLRECLECLTMELLYLCLCPLFMILIINVVNYVELFFVVV